MRALLYAIMTVLFAAGAAPALADTMPPATTAPHVAMTLVPETATPRAGGTMTLAFDARPAPGWHAYWSNPGDAGIDTRLTWTLPAGARAGVLRYPVPGRLLIAGLMNHVYERPYALLVDVALPAGLAVGTRLPVSVKADYLVCTDSLCVPEVQTLATTLTIGDGAVASAERARFDAWRRALPRPLGGAATFERAVGRFRLAVPYPAAAPLGDAWFFPLASGATDYAAPQTVIRDGDRLVIETAAATTAPTGDVAGVLATGDGGGLSLVAHAGQVPAVGAREARGWMAALLAFAGAVLGGLLLNVMPCVFPILSLKALGLARSGAGAREARGEALAYTAGVVLVCVGLGALILALRAGGTAVGWAFQLQDPGVVALLLVLCLGIALNLSGVFEFATPRFAGESGVGGAFATGALAAFVATPCTGPFMAAALGAALVLPWFAALAVFAGLGLGLALPFLLIGFVPALRRRLPRPGAWMVTARRVLALPMWLTAAGLAWLLARQLGTTGVPLELAAVAATALALAWGGRRQRQGRGFGAAATLAVALVAGGTVAVARTAPTATRAATGDGRFSEARLAQLRGARRPVFAYFTADWCLTCKVNERVAIDTATARDAFAAGHVAVLVGDWTDGDPALGRFIEAQNRAGVPLYLYYAPGAAAPRVLPQVLTPGMLAGL